jgi:hypothetical protein
VRRQQRARTRATPFPTTFDAGDRVSRAMLPAIRRRTGAGQRVVEAGRPRPRLRLFYAARAETPIYAARAATRRMVVLTKSYTERAVPTAESSRNS